MQLPERGRVQTEPDFQLRGVVAANVRRLRKGLGFSQEAFADACGLHRTYIGSIERAERNVSIDNIERMALDIDAWLLLRPDRSSELPSKDASL